MPRLLTALIALSLAGVADPGPNTQWTRVSTEHFTVSGDAPPADIRQAATRLESVRGVLTETLPRMRDHSLLPTFVVVRARSNGSACSTRWTAVALSSSPACRHGRGQ